MPYNIGKGKIEMNQRKGYANIKTSNCMQIFFYKYNLILIEDIISLARE
jgi:hypothetical protein